MKDERRATDARSGPGEGAARVQEAVDRARLRRLGIRVLIVQVLALVGLWLLQTRFGTP